MRYNVWIETTTPVLTDEIKDKIEKALIDSGDELLIDIYSHSVIIERDEE